MTTAAPTIGRAPAPIPAELTAPGAAVPAVVRPIRQTVTRPTVAAVARLARPTVPAVTHPTVPVPRKASA